MDERMQFIAAWLRHEESLSVLCRRFEISRKTGYKLLARYEAEGAGGLQARSHARHRQPHALTEAVEHTILELRGTHPRWGPRKLRAWLQQRRAGQTWPAASTIGALLHRHGLTMPRRRRLHASPSRGSTAGAPNDVWAADFKGWFRTGDQQRCDPLTISDLFSRYLLRCQVVAGLADPLVRPLFEATFREYGLPRAIRTDNGPPFASLAAGGLSRLAVWWVRLGIRPERIAPGHPEQNAQHERMHRTLKEETAQPPERTGRAQQRAFDRFRPIYNDERPHEALGQQPPAAWYQPSPRPFPERLPALEYPAPYVVRRTHPNGEINWLGGRVFISQALAGELVGLEEIAEGHWRVCFGPVTLGGLDARRPHRLYPPDPAPRAELASVAPAVTTDAGDQEGRQRDTLRAAAATDRQVGAAGGGGGAP
jgi:transposase InsO family protein